MEEEASRAETEEQRELAALRQRAYAPDATIDGDTAAFSRLVELEDRRRAERFPTAQQPDPPVPASVVSTPADRGASAPASRAFVITGASGAQRVQRWHSGLIASAALIAVLLGGAAWSDMRPQGVSDAASEEATSAAAANGPRATGYEADYRGYIEGLREEVLALPGTELVADQVIRDRLKPYGILYGRTVGAGPTLDDRRCMIIADLPKSSITCIPAEDTAASPVSVTLPEWYSDAESDVFTGLGESVTYTLMPGGGVVAMLSDQAPATAPVPAPTATAVPPPGWQ